MRKRVTVTKKSETGRNIRFRDNLTGEELTRTKFVKAIENDKYDDFHVRKINGVKTPVSNPDNSTNNNLDS